MNLSPQLRKRCIATQPPGDALHPIPTKPARAQRGKAARAKARSLLEQRFAYRWDGPAFVEQYQFDPGRKWRLDIAWPRVKVAVELHGATWSGGRHTRGSGFARDREKMNRAQEMGWLVYELTGDMLDGDWLARIADEVERRFHGKEQTR